jgi:hypothetical protein
MQKINKLLSTITATQYSAIEVLLSITVDYYRLTSITVYYCHALLDSLSPLIFILTANQTLIHPLGCCHLVCNVVLDAQLFLLQSGKYVLKHTVSTSYNTYFYLICWNVRGRLFRKTARNNWKVTRTHSNHDLKHKTAIRKHAICNALGFPDLSGCELN